MSNRFSRAFVARRHSCALLGLLLLLPALTRAEAPAPPTGAIERVSLPRPGSREAAQRSLQAGLRGPDRQAFTRAPSGLLVPDKRLFVARPEDLRDLGRWHATRRAVFRYLEHSGVRTAPASYQRLVSRIRLRAERAMSRQGQGLGSWKMVVVEGGIADVENAAAWSGGLITINRPMVDLCFQIASVMVNSGSELQRDKELWRLSRWRQRGATGTAPEALSVAPDKQARRDAIAESILARVVLHEMGHAASGHVALRERKLIVPGEHRQRDLARSVAQEHEADQFAVRLGLAGGTRVPGVMPFLDYYRFIDRPSFSARGPRELADWRTHPISAERYNNQRRELAPRARGLPAPLAPQLVLPGQR